MTAAVLWLGFVLGLRHALDADHVVAVVSLATRSRSIADAARIAGGWGFGHGLVLLLVGGLVSLAGLRFPPQLAARLELVAGVLLLILGFDVLRRLWRAHRHAEGTPHVDPPLVSRALLVGSAHGLAGSGVLAVAVLPALPSTTAVLVYLGLFGAGSILGMLLCSLALSVPLRLSLRTREGARLLLLGAGTTSIVLGLWVALHAL